MAKLVLMLVVTGVIGGKISKLNPPDATAGWDVKRTPATTEWIENLAFELSDRTVGGCRDTPNWRSDWNSCSGYEWMHMCENGVLIPPYVGGSEHNYPERNCCSCGKQAYLDDVEKFCKDVLEASECQQISFLGMCDLGTHGAGTRYGFGWMCVSTCGLQKECQNEVHGIYGKCIDTDNGAEGRNYMRCRHFVARPHQCGQYDNSDFSSNQMCCACGGGNTA